MKIIKVLGFTLLALICQIGMVAQCDLNLYGLDVSQTNQLQIKQFNSETGELAVRIDSSIEISNVLTGSHTLMNDVYYFVDQSSSIYAFNIKSGSFISKQSILAKDLRFIEPDACDSLLYGIGFQSTRGPAYLNAYDPSNGIVSRITPNIALLPIALDQNSKHAKLGDSYILVADTNLYVIDTNIGQITNQFSVADEGLISYVADENSGLLYGIQITTTGFTLKTINPFNGEINTVGTTVKNYTGIAKSAHAISDGHYYVMIDRSYYKLDLNTGQVVAEYPIHLDIFKFIEFNNSCLPLIDVIEPSETSCGQDNGLIRVMPVDTMSSYNYQWEGPDDQFTTNESTLRDLAPGEYKLTITSMDGTCREQTTTLIDESAELEYQLEHKNLGCVGEDDGEIHIAVEGESNNYQYSINSGITFQDSAHFIGLGEGDYNILIKGNKECTASDTVILEKPSKIDVELNEPMEIALGKEIIIEPTLTNTNPDVELTWTSTNPQFKISCTDCENPSIQPLSNTTYYLSIQDINTGCMAIDSIDIAVRENLRDVYIPNIFSPNGDGYNDEFTVFGTDVAHINSFSIFDKWGAQIKSVSNVQPDDPQLIWDGKYLGNTIASGSFTYLADIRFLDGVERKISGQLLLVK